MVVLVDASNVAHGKTSAAAPPKLDNLRRVLERLRRFPIQVIPLADASLRHKIDRKAELEEMLRVGEIEQVPAGTAADDFLWQAWKTYSSQGRRAYILTNDKFPLEYARAESRSGNPRIAFLMLGTELMFQPPIESLLPPAPSSAPADEPTESPSPAAGRKVGLIPPESPTVVAWPSESDIEAATREVIEVDNAVRRSLETVPPGQAGEAEATLDQRLSDSAIEVIALLTDPPGGRVRRVNFATVSHDLHQRSDGDFVSKFGLRRPKDLATKLVELGLVNLSHTNTTLYVEPTPALEERIRRQGLSRRNSSRSTEGAGATGSTGSALPPPPDSEGHSDRSLPEVVEVSSRSPGPSIEVASPEQFVDLVNETHPKHVFHWWSWYVVDEKRRREGEFFFVLDGTYYRLAGRGYRSLGDFIDGRNRGVKGAEDFKHPSRGGYGERLSCWLEIVKFNGLEYGKERPSEADVYYYLKERGLPDFESLKAADQVKTGAPEVVEY